MYPRVAIALLFSFVAFGLSTAFVVPNCGPNAEFQKCGSACPSTCAEPEPKVCTLQCIMGCFCKPGFLRNMKGECVLKENCEAPQQQQNYVLPQCPENEFFHMCGSACAPTCAKPQPVQMCTRQCVIGCFCKPGYLRNKMHVCVPAANCEAPAPVNNLFAYPPGYTPMPKVCDGENEEYRQCKGCDGTCEEPNPPCPRICIPGCACKNGHVRDGNGKCMQLEKCPKTALNMNFAYPPGYTPEPVEPKVCAGENEEFRQCKGCDGTCTTPNPPCPRICVAGCACKHGHVRDVNGKCMKLEQCPKLALNMMMMPPVCKNNEVFKTCGTACPATCADPHPSAICTKQCVIGCFCKEGYLRHANGDCVAAANCEMQADTGLRPYGDDALLPMRPYGDDALFPSTRPYGDDILCPTDREVYLDSDKASEFNCMQSCDTPLPWMIQGKVVIPPKCKEVKPAPGCVCRFPYYRNEEGKCVERQECHQTTTPVTATPAH